MNTMIVIKSGPEEDKQISESLRLCAAMIGMDDSPYVVFRNEGIECLKQGAIEDGAIMEYLQTASNLAGVYYLKESGKIDEILDIALDPIPLTLQEFTEHMLECKTVVTY